MSDNKNSANRSIPADIRRRVLVEAGHRCAIPTCRHIEVEIHHIKPFKKVKSHVYENLIALCPNCHSRADRGEIDRKSLKIYKVNLRFAHDKFSQIEMDLVFDLYKSEEHEKLWPPYLEILLRRILDPGYITVSRSKVDIKALGLSITPDLVRLTQKGREFVESLSIRDL